MTPSVFLLLAACGADPDAIPAVDLDLAASEKGYPITPVLRRTISVGSSPAWRAHGVGDYNGDGFDDFAISVWDTAAAGTGQLWVYRSTHAIPSSPAVILMPPATSTGYGTTFATLGDVDGDGYDDVGVGSIAAGGATPDLTAFSGGHHAFDPTPDWNPTPSGYYQWLGQTIADRIDVNGDGVNDVVASDSDWVNGSGMQVGRIVGYVTSGATLPLTPSWQVSGSDGFGGGVVGAGDVNADGYGDFMVLGQSRNDAALYLGGAAGPTYEGWTTDALFLYPYPTEFIGGGDYNGDGYDDLIVACAQCQVTQPGQGVLYGWYGSASGVNSGLFPDFTIGGAPHANMGEAGAVTALDENGDGYTDIAVGTYDSAGGPIVAIYRGRPSGLTTTAVWTLTGTSGGFTAAPQVGNGGDINGDGRDDLMVADSTTGTVWIYTQ